MNTFTFPIQNLRYPRLIIDAGWYGDSMPPKKQNFKIIRYLLEPGTLRPFIMLVCYVTFAYAASIQGAKNYYIVIFNRLNLPIDSNFLCVST